MDVRRRNGMRPIGVEQRRRGGAISKRERVSDSPSPVGHALVNRIGVETFRRVCMSFDAYLVSFGLARTLTGIGVSPVLAYQLLVITALIDGRLLYGYFRYSTPRISSGLANRPYIPPV